LRQFQHADRQGTARALRYIAFDTVSALAIAFVINSAILVTAASVFHAAGRTDVAEIQDAYRLLSPLTGATWASVVFGVALLASGQCSAVTASLAGQVVMEGFIRTRLPPWARRLLTRCVERGHGGDDADGLAALVPNVHARVRRAGAGGGVELARLRAGTFRMQCDGAAARRIR
jgi:hypothetical protein